MARVSQAEQARPRVLFLGAEPTAAISALERHGAHVTTVLDVGSAKAELARSDERRGRVVVADSASVEDVLYGLARSHLDLASFDLVTAQDEHHLLAASVLGDVAGKRGLALHTAIAMRDKFTQKALVREAGWATAACEVVLHDAPAPDMFPGVVKPLAGAGTHDTRRVETSDDLKAFLQDRSGGPWLLETFTEGREVSCDGVVRDGEVVALMLTRYLNNLIDLHDGALVGCIAIPPIGNEALYESAHDHVTGVLKALGHTDGVFHAEFFEAAGHLTFGECAARVGGGKISDIFERQLGVDLYEEWARAGLRLRSALPSGLVSGRPGTDEGRGTAGWVALALPAGLVEAVPSPSELQALPGIIFAEVTAELGDRWAGQASGSDVRAGRVIAEGCSEAEVRARLAYAYDWFMESAHVN